MVTTPTKQCPVGVVSVGRRCLPVFVGLSLTSWLATACGAAPAQATGFSHMPPSALSPHGPAAAVIANSSWILFAVATAGCLLVIGLLIYALTRRRSQHAPATPGADRPQPLSKQARRSGTVWIVGGGILMPAVILAGVFILNVSTFNAQPTHAGSNVSIQVIGHQWWWEVHYADYAFDTANEIHIPVGQPVTLTLTSADVIHSFWVPELAGKLDLIPGQTNTLVLEADQAGDYRGQCAEFCGRQHALMGVLVVAQPAADFEAWVTSQQPDAPVPADDHLYAGQQVFLGSACVYCHTVRGTNATGQIGPDLTHVASRRTLAAVSLLNSPGGLAGWVIDPQGVKPGNKMPPTDLNADELLALLDYLETLK